MILYGIVDLSSDNGLLPVSTKSLPEPMFTDHQLDHQQQTFQKFQDMSITLIMRIYLIIQKKDKMTPLFTGTPFANMD